MKIIGTGLAGLIVGALNQKAELFEPLSGLNKHNALLRFRTPDIGEALGIPFKKVRVYKGVWDNGPVGLSPLRISQYSQKVSDRIEYRSITSLGTEDRWIAPDNFQQMLIEECFNRIQFSTIPDLTKRELIISTIPIFKLAECLGYRICITNAESLPIYVKTYELENCNVYMTNYFPGSCTDIYRASITGDKLIIESMASFEDISIVLASFGLVKSQLKTTDAVEVIQRNGKMGLTDESMRRAFISRTTVDYNIYSLGRLAVWRNIVLDEVYKDYLQIKTMINKDHYEHIKRMK